MSFTKTFFISLLCLGLLGWGHSGPKVTIGFWGLEFPGREVFLKTLKRVLEDENADLKVLAQDPGTDGLQAVILYGGEPGKDWAQKAHSHGIPLLTLDRPLFGGSQDFCVVYDPGKVGETQARSVFSQVPKGKYLLWTSTKDPFFRSFQKGQMKAIQKAISLGEVHVTTRSQDLAKAEAVLTAEGRTEEVERILAKRKEAALLATVGQDLATCRAIGAGKPQVSVYESPLKLAEEAAYLSVKAARKAKTFDCQFVDLPWDGGTVRAVFLTPQVLDAKTLESTVIKDGIWTREEIFGKKEP